MSLSEILHGAPLRSPVLVSIHRRLRSLLTSKAAIGLLVVLATLRSVLFLIAYPPAHGADSADYFLYAAQFKGLDAPIVFELIYPLYPSLIYLTHYVLGSVYILIGVQVLLAILQGPLFFWGLSSYSPVLGFAMALLVIGDAQTGILFNFTSTEPIYMFALTLAFALFLRQHKTTSRSRVQAGDLLLGVVLAIVLLARPVGRYLIVPFGILFLLGTRQVWRSAIVLAGFGITLLGFMMFNQFVFNRFELNGGGSFMLNRPLIRSGLLDEENGPASARLLTMRAACPQADRMTQCLIDQAGDWPAVRQLYADAYQEMLRKRGSEFAEQVFNAFTDFLQLPGQQYSGPIAPSDAQCADTEAKVERDTTALLEKDWLLYGTSDLTYERLSPIVRDIATAMCPPLPDNDWVRRVVDYVALRYRSLSRPHPYLWYGTLGLLVLVIPSARRLLIPVLLAGAILANHAAISAMVLNVQPRYIAVVNPYKGFLLLTLFYILGRLLVGIVDQWLAQRTRARTLDQ